MENDKGFTLHLLRSKKENVCLVPFKKGAGFTLIELLVVLAIMALMGSIVMVGVKEIIEKAYFEKSKKELRSIVEALHMFVLEENDYPVEQDRGIPPAIEKYLSSKPDWPKAPWPGSEFDWDNWSPDMLKKKPNEEQVYQISIRFCELGDKKGETCRFPNEDWVTDKWDYYSSVYWCISGPCRAHNNKKYEHAGCCIGGACPSDQSRCE